MEGQGSSLAGIGQVLLLKQSECRAYERLLHGCVCGVWCITVKNVYVVIPGRKLTFIPLHISVLSLCLKRDTCTSELQLIKGGSQMHCVNAATINTI